MKHLNYWVLLYPVWLTRSTINCEIQMEKILVVGDTLYATSIVA